MWLTPYLARLVISLECSFPPVFLPSICIMQTKKKNGYSIQTAYPGSVSLTTLFKIAGCLVFGFQIVNRHGPEADRHLLRCLFSHVDFSGDGKSSGKDFHQVNVAFG